MDNFLRDKRFLFALSIIFTGLVIFYTVTYLRLNPFLGFQYQPNGTIVEIFTPESGSGDLLVGDQLLSINGKSLDSVRTDLSSSFYSNLNTAGRVTFRILRDGTIRQIEWQLPGYNQAEMNNRLVNLWPISYVFLVAGLTVVFSLDRKDLRSFLYILFCFISALWLITGLNSRFGLYSSRYLFRFAIWLCLPIYLHFHWEFPAPIRNIPSFYWLSLYGVALLGFGNYFLPTVPHIHYLIPFSLAILGSGVILLFHWIGQKESRQDLLLVVVSFLVAFLPALVIASVAYSSLQINSIGGLLLSLVALPGGYAFVLYKPQLGLSGAERTVNRFISAYITFFVQLLILIILFPFITLLNASNAANGLIILFITLLATGATLLFFARFNEYVEGQLLWDNLEGSYNSDVVLDMISNTRTTRELIQTLKEINTKTLRIDFMVIVLKGERGQLDSFNLGIHSSSDIPLYEDISLLPFPKSAKDWILFPPNALRERLTWLHAVMLLRSGNETIGWWLIGEKTTGEFFRHFDRTLLIRLAKQASLLVTQFMHQEQIQSLSRKNVEEKEHLQTQIARSLHDGVLTAISELSITDLKEPLPQNVTKVHQLISDSIRQVIYSLRPPLLDFGLKTSLEDLANSSSLKVSKSPGIIVKIKENIDRSVRSEVDQHVYRIIEQALKNAILHSDASEIKLIGEITSTSIDLRVCDNGKGFDSTNLLSYMHNMHFGLASIQERAAMINADLDILSNPGEGTTIHLVWTDDA